ncbi:CAP domain-containing protein [Streptomyces sp. NPDC051921]|uniref:CAP domain-containing protein n=1 Tax=Streptomyces sp. NPDC051921 TaxID=3155806 RepID=UPI003421B8F9
MGRHRGARRGAPVRTGLLGVSAAVAVGAAVVASGLLPGGDTFTVDSANTAERHVEAQQAPSLTTQGGASATPAGQGSGKPAGNGRAVAPSAKPTPKPSATKPTPTPSAKASKTPAPAPTKTVRPTGAPVTEAPATKAPTTAPTTVVRSLGARESAAEAEVVRLVNLERAKVGCTPIRNDSGLASLAGAYSADMAARNFFDHTDPDGATPWDRAAKVGVTGLGGENIARGQVDAAAVMKSWMASDGHRANILNCDYKVLGVGVHFGDGGPWWTQDFGF